MARVIPLGLKSSQGADSTLSCQNFGFNMSAHLWSEVLSTTHGIKGSRNLLSDGSVAISTDLMGLCASLT